MCRKSLRLSLGDSFLEKVADLVGDLAVEPGRFSQCASALDEVTPQRHWSALGLEDAGDR
jgi:hypothetical protein